MSDPIIVIQVITIIVTILGFSVTTQRQRELLDNQKKIERYKFVFDERNKQLREFSEYMKNWETDNLMMYAAKILKHKGKVSQAVNDEFEAAKVRSIRRTMMYGYHHATCFGLWQQKYKINIGDALEKYRHFKIELLELGTKDFAKVKKLQKEGKDWEEYTPKAFQDLQKQYRVIMSMIDDIYERLSEIG